MANTMKIHAYLVASVPEGESLEDVFTTVGQMHFPDRVRDVGNQRMRLEDVASPSRLRPYWLADFTNIRFEHGPGKASAAQPIQGFPMQQGEGFGEETALLYDARLRHCVIQYNHYGPRPSSIAQYLSMFAPDEAPHGFSFQIRMSGDAEVRLGRKQHIKKIEYKVASAGMTKQQRKADISLGRSLEISDRFGGQTIDVKISAGRGELFLPRVREIVRQLSDLWKATSEPGKQEVVQMLRVTGKDAIDAESEVIDMLLPKLEHESGNLKLGQDLRYTRESRFVGLIAARNMWARQLARRA